MPIQPAQLARSLGALSSLDVEQDLAVTLPQVLGSAKTLLDADRVGLMLIDQAGALRWATASDGVIEAVAGGDLSVPVRIGSDPVGTLDVYVTAPREWDDSAAAALQAYAGLVGSLLVAAMTARVTGRLADQLKGALEHRSLIERAVPAIVDREDRLASARPDGTTGAATLAERRPSVCRRPPRVAGSSTPKPNGAAPTTHPEHPSARRWLFVGGRPGEPTDGHDSRPLHLLSHPRSLWYSGLRRGCVGL